MKKKKETEESKVINFNINNNLKNNEVVKTGLFFGDKKDKNEKIGEGNKIDIKNSLFANNKNGDKISNSQNDTKGSFFNNNIKSPIVGTEKTEVKNSLFANKTTEGNKNSLFANRKI